MLDTGQNSIPSLLIARKTVLELLRKMEHDKDYSPDNIEQIGEFISSYGSKIIPVILHEMEQVREEWNLKKYEYLIEFLDNEAFVPHLVSLLAKKHDDLKLRKVIIKILKFYCVDFNHPPLSRYIMEFQEDIRTLAADLAESIDSEWDFLMHLLEEFHFMETEDQVKIAGQMKELASPGALRVLRLFLRTGIKEVISESLSVLGMLRNPESLDILEESLIYLPAVYSKIALRNIRKLKFAGIVSAGASYDTDAITEAYIGYPMAYGLRQLLFIFEQGSTRHALFYEFEEKHGFIECYGHFNLQAEEIGALVNEFEEEYLVRKVDKIYAVRIFRDAIRNSYLYDNSFPYAFCFLSLSLPPHFLGACRYRCEAIREKMPQLLPQNPDDVSLWPVIEPLGWLSEDERFTDLIERWYRKPEDTEKIWMDDLLIRRVVREIIIPSLETWKERLCILADFLFALSEGLDHVPVILSVERQMKRDIESLAAMPFIRTMVLESKKIVISEIKEVQQ